MTHLQAAFAESHADFIPQDTRINDVIGLGLYAVVHVYPEFCGSTDAYMGQKRSLQSYHATREEAVAACPAGDVEDDFVVWPLQG